MTRGHVTIDGEVIPVKFYDKSDEYEDGLLIAQLDSVLEQMDNENQTKHGQHQRPVPASQSPAR